MVQIVSAAAQRVEAVQIGGLQMLYAHALQRFEGVTSAGLDVVLPRNALVDDYRVLVQARRVDTTRVQEVAQVRSYAKGTASELVIDFGTPRTVSGIELPSGVNVHQVYAWLGAQFSPTAAYSRAVADATPDAVFTELRTERLRVVLSKALSATQFDAVTMRLPEPPSGLDIRIDGGPAVWTHAESVQPRATAIAPTADGWDRDSRRIVVLTDALAALTGDPLAPDEPVVFHLTLTTQVPCQLALALQGEPSFRRIRRVRFGTETGTTIDFTGEGSRALPLTLPPVPAGANRRIDEVRWVASADLPPWRVMPPMGPAAVAGTGVPVLADLRVEPERAVCVRLSGRCGLDQLTGIRLPLRAGGDGAELRVVLWSAGEGTEALPGEPLPQGASEPLVLDASDEEQWVGLVFPKAVAVRAAAMPWMVLSAARGEVWWSLATRVAGEVALNDHRVRRGPPGGPWRALPAPLQNAAGLLDARGRLRHVGLAPKTAPVAPLTLALAGRPPVDLNPNAKGVPGALWTGVGFVAAQPVLELVSRTAGAVQLRDIDVISSV